MPVRPVRRRRAAPSAVVRLVLAALLVLLPLAGCAAQPAPAPAAEPAALPKQYDARALLSTVSARQRAEAGARTVLHGSLDGAGGRRTVDGEGALRWSGDAVDVRFDQHVGAAGQPRRTTGLIRTAGRTFLRVPEAGSGRWIELGRDDVPPADRSDATLATNLALTADPLAAVRRYADASLVADATDEAVDGVPAVRYTIVVDLTRAAAAETDPAMRAQLDAQVRGGLTRISTQVWVDAASRPVRARMAQELPGAGSLDMVTDYRSWGAPVAIDPPVRGG